MMKLEDILAMWKKDSEIDEMNLDSASIQSAKLHSKYLELLSVTKLQLRKREMEFKILLKNKWLHYHGKLSKAEIDQLGWDYDPLNGLKILKGDMNHFFDADKEIQAAQAKVDYIKAVLDALDEIMQNIKWRHQNIKNIIDWRRFTSGA